MSFALFERVWALHLNLRPARMQSHRHVRSTLASSSRSIFPSHHVTQTSRTVTPAFGIIMHDDRLRLRHDDFASASSPVLYDDVYGRD